MTAIVWRWLTKPRYSVLWMATYIVVVTILDRGFFG